jgi:hypothetical protein
MKATCKTSFLALKGIIDIGDVVEIESILSTEDKVLNTKIIVTRDENERIISSVVVSDVVSPKGSFEGYRIKSKNGNTYSDKEILGMIEYKPLSEIFEK